MDFGKLPENVYERSIYKVIRTTEYEQKTLNGAGLGADCAILPFADSLLASAQGQAFGKDVTVGVRAMYHALNRLAAAGIFAAEVMVDENILAAQVSITLPHSDKIGMPEHFQEPFLRELVRLMADKAIKEKITITSVDSMIVPNMQTALVTVNITAQAFVQEFHTRSKALPEQDVVMTKWLGLEGTSLIAAQRMEELTKRYPLGLLEDAAGFDRFLSIVPEAATAAKSGVSAMQVVREGGIFGGLWQLAQSNGVGLVIDLKKIPVKQETIEVCEFYDVNPYELLSGGSLLITTDNGARLVSELGGKQISAAVIGRTTDNNDRILVNDEERRFLEPARHDSLYKVLTDIS